MKSVRAKSAWYGWSVSTRTEIRCAGSAPGPWRSGAGPGEARHVEAAVERFLTSPSLSDATRRAYRYDVEEFCSWLRRRGTKLDDVDVAVLADYVAELGAARSGRAARKLAPATISRKLAAVRAFLRFT